MRCPVRLLAVAFITCICCSGAKADHFEVSTAFSPKTQQSPSIVSRVWKSDITRTLFAGVALTRLSMQFDSDAHHEVATKTWAESDMVDVGETYADGAFLAGLTAVTWGVGTVSGHDNMRQTGVCMAKGFLLDAIAVTGLKAAVGRTRPDGSDARSFPSGHTSTAFTLSTVLSRRHGWKIGLPAYGLATMAAVARVEDNRHYLSDVVAGAVLGIAIGKLVTPRANMESGSWQVVASPSKVGLRLKF